MWESRAFWQYRSRLNNNALQSIIRYSKVEWITGINDTWTQDVLHEYHHELCRNHANSSSHGQCPGTETIKSEGQWIWRSVKELTDVTISSLLRRMQGDILARSPVASGKTSKRQTSSLSTSIVIEKPWRGHKLGLPETLLQVRNSRVNDWMRNEHTQCHKQARHTLATSLIILSLPWPDWSVKAWVNDGCHYRNINIYIPATFVNAVGKESSLPPFGCSTCLDILCQTSHSR